MTKQQELARRRAYEAARKQRWVVPVRVCNDRLAYNQCPVDGCKGGESRFVADLQAELKAARLTMLREGWF